MAAPAPAPAAAPALRAAPAAPAWTQVRIQAEGRSIVVPRGQSGALTELVARMLVAPGVPASATAPATLRLEMLQGSQPMVVLEFDGEHWRWRRPGRAAQQGWLLRPDAALGGALRSEAERLLGP